MYGRELLWGAGTFAEQVDRLADPARAPRYIVGVQAFDFFGGDLDGAMRAVVARDYLLEATIDGVPFYTASLNAATNDRVLGGHRLARR